METNGTRETNFAKEFRCRDCGALLTAPHGALSLTCAACGNVAFLAAAEGGSILARRVLSQLEAARSVAQAEPSLLERTLAKADGAKTEALLIRYQTEWQLWAMLVANFSEPEYHAAYLTLAASTLQLDSAADRYAAHSKAMMSLKETAWQAEAAEAMLARVRALTVVQCERSTAKNVPSDWLKRPAVLFACFVGGLILTMHYVGGAIAHLHHFR